MHLKENVLGADGIYGNERLLSEKYFLHNI